MSKSEGHKRIKVYVHRQKESNWDLARAIAKNKEAESQLGYLGYEEELVYDVCPETGKQKLVAAGGFYLSDEKVTEGDLDKVDS